LDNLEVCYAMFSLLFSKNAAELDQGEIQFNEDLKKRMDNIARRMTDAQISVAKELAADMSKPKNLLIALDSHLEKAKKEAEN
jgi:hypothetical protein